MLTCVELGHDFLQVVKLPKLSRDWDLAGDDLYSMERRQGPAHRCAQTGP
jgi:hypothetical protein